MLEPLLVVFFPAYYLDSVLVLAGVLAALGYYEQLFVADARHYRAALVRNTLLQCALGVLVAQLFRWVNGERVSWRERVSLQRVLGGNTLEALLYCVLFLTALLPYRRASLDESGNSFAIGLLISVLLLVFVAQLLEAYEFYNPSAAAAASSSASAATRQGRLPSVLRHANQTMHVKSVGVALLVIAVDALAYEMRWWHVAVLAGYLLVQQLGARAFDALALPRTQSYGAIAKLHVT